jgi:hypothetical protein
MSEQELHRWAVEQAIKLLADNGAPSEKIIEAADQIIAYVGEADA